MSRYPAVDLGPLPVDLINDVLGTELEPGDVRLSTRAHRHIAEDHPADYAICFATLAQAIAAPTFVGQGPRGDGNFEIIRRIGRIDGRVVLVAIGLERDAQGTYRVKSSYLLTAAQVDNRRAKGTLKAPRPR